MIPKTLTILLLLISQHVCAQQNAASMEFFNSLSDCAGSLGGWKCLELDLSSEAAMENDSTKVYVYSWNLGDGNRKQGNKIDHCYDQFGSYQVTMDLIDAETNTVIRNELSSTVHLYPEIQPAIITRTENLPPSFMEFSCKYNYAERFEPDRVYWRIDGVYYEGNTIVHSFHSAGVYLIEMGIEKNTDLIGTVTACATTEITIKESDVWTSQIINFIETAREKIVAGPFAGSDVFCLIKPKSEKIESSIIPINFLMSQVNLKEGQEYEIILFSGNLFTQKKQLNTHGITGNNLYRALKDTVSAFLRQPLTFLKTAAFEKDKTNQLLNESELKQTAELLLQNPYIKIEIGSYIHSGSRIEKGIQTSLQRATFIKDTLVKYGVSAERISIASPEYNKALMSTCSAVPDCNWENKALNGKVEFKITGTNL